MVLFLVIHEMVTGRCLYSVMLDADTGCGHQWDAISALMGSLSSGLTKTLDFCDFQRTWKAPQAAWPLPGEMLVSVLSYLFVRSTNVFGAAPCAGDDAGELEVSPASRAQSRKKI